MIAPGNYGLVAVAALFGIGAIVAIATGKALSGRYLGQLVKRAEEPGQFWFTVGLYAFASGGIVAVLIRYHGQ